MTDLVTVWTAFSLFFFYGKDSFRVYNSIIHQLGTWLAHQLEGMESSGGGGIRAGRFFSGRLISHAIVDERLPLPDKRTLFGGGVLSYLESTADFYGLHSLTWVYFDCNALTLTLHSTFPSLPGLFKHCLFFYLVWTVLCILWMSCASVDESFLVFFILFSFLFHLTTFSAIRLGQKCIVCRKVRWSVKILFFAHTTP